MLRGKVRQVLGNHELGFDFDQGSSGAPQEVMEFIGGETCLPLCNVGRDPNR